MRLSGVPSSRRINSNPGTLPDSARRKIAGSPDLKQATSPDSKTAAISSGLSLCCFAYQEMACRILSISNRRSSIMDDETRAFLRAAYQFLEKHDQMLRDVQIVNLAL